MHQVRALVSCIQPGLVICFTLDNIHNIEILKREGPISGTPWVPVGLFLNFTLSKIHHHPAVDSRMLCKLPLLMPSMTFYPLSSPVPPPRLPGGIWKVESTTFCGHRREACCPPPQHHPRFLIRFSFPIPFIRSSSFSHVQKF